MLPVVAHATILLDRVVAVVNKEVITWSELFRLMESEATEQVKSLTEQERMKLFKESETLFLERLIDMRLQLQEAHRLGLEATPEEVTETIENIKKKYALTQESLIDSLKKEGLTLEEYKKRLSEQIVLSKVINQQIRSKVIVSDEEVKSYIEANKEIFSGGETYRLRQIFFMRPKSVEDKTAVEEKALLVIQRLKAGEDFSLLAREFSEDPSGKRDGDLGIVKKEYLAKEFVGTLSTMKVGDFSMPFWTEKGLHIIKLEDRVSAQNIDEVKEEVRKKLTGDKFLERYKSWIKGLREKAYIEIYL
jgi:peptidyl-prolyl cis-trans isomerase SurA